MVLSTALRAGVTTGVVSLVCACERPRVPSVLASIARLHIVAIGALGTLTWGWGLTGRYLPLLAVLSACDWFVVNLLNRVVDLDEDLHNGIIGAEVVARHRRRTVAVGVVVLGVPDGDKVTLLVALTADVAKAGKLHAGNLIKELAPIVGGKGGGKPDLAQAGGSKPEALDEALAKAKVLIEAALA